VQAPAGVFTDLSLGGDGRLAACYGDGADHHGVLVFHLRRRWRTSCDLAEAPIRAVIDEEDRVWVVTATELVLCEGEPLPHPYEPRGERFEPENGNPSPLRVRWRQPLPEAMSPLALCVDDRWVYVLVHDAADAQHILARPRTGVAQRPFKPYRLNADIPFVVDLAVASPGRLAGLSPRETGDSGFVRRDCPVLGLRWHGQAQTGEAGLIRERYPMLSQEQPRFVSSLDGVLRYQGAADPGFPGFSPRPRELHRLLRPSYPKAAQVSLRRVLDAGRPDTVWHRLYLEGSIPPGCELVVFAKAFNLPEQRGRAPYVRQPRPLWNPLPSELPYFQGLVESRPGTSGLFEVLLQRESGNVRRLTGRYLQLRLRMSGDGRRTPAVHAIRIYHPRFSYQEHYLPEHFRQEEALRPESGGAPTPANGADVRERLLANLEGLLTPIEGRIAAAEVLLHPAAAPEEHLGWVGEVLGTRVPGHWSAARRRRLIASGGALQRRRGTLAGVRLALDIATDGMVARGEIVLVENFRLRRTMATILGLDMDDRDHPLTLGTGMSGNSIVGDALILSESDARTFLALLAPELADGEDQAIVEAFFDRYSHQVSVLLHGRARREGALVDEVLAEQMPAHVQWRVLETDHPFVLGLAPLLEVDTYLEVRPPPRRVTLGDTYLSKEGLLQNPTALSPRDVNATRHPPPS
jgi:phage tail-like protein